MWRDHGLTQFVAKTERNQDSAGVRGNLQAGADLAEARRLFDNIDVVTVAGEGEGGRQPANAGTDDENVAGCHSALLELQ